MLPLRLPLCSCTTETQEARFEVSCFSPDRAILAHFALDAWAFEGFSSMFLREFYAVTHV